MLFFERMTRCYECDNVSRETTLSMWCTSSNEAVGQPAGAANRSSVIRHRAHPVRGPAQSLSLCCVVSSSGYITLAEVYRYILEDNEIESKIRALQTTLNQQPQSSANSPCRRNNPRDRSLACVWAHTFHRTICLHDVQSPSALEGTTAIFVITFCAGPIAPSKDCSYLVRINFSWPQG
jgi:hypothetical protein